MPEITLYLTIENSNHFGSGELYEKKIDTPFCPRNNSRVFLWGDNVGHYWAVNAFVKYVYWNPDGSVCVSLQHWVIDPSDSMEHYVGRGTNPLHAWRTKDEGYSFIDALLENGWKQYGS